ncbi:MAG: hypothetical protein D6719_07720 [Candidatus Dadabacteria bacterium]|nr:MAG: hypothetical protein D6719_07720 [Candidatus Dadabacteria bacterium]
MLEVAGRSARLFALQLIWLCMFLASAGAQPLEGDHTYGSYLKWLHVISDPADPPYRVKDNVKENLDWRIQREIPGSTALPIKLQNKWSEVYQAINKNDLKAANKALNQLNVLRLEGDYRSLDDYSIYLLTQANKAYGNGDIDSAAFYARRALALSPLSPRVVAASLVIARKTHTASLLEQIRRIITGLQYYPAAFFSILKDSIYPFLWALTIGLYVAYFMYLCVRIPDFFRIIARKLPDTIRGISSWFIVLILFVAPVFCGPLWTLTAWSILIAVFVPSRRYLIAASGSVLVLWGVLMPLKENMQLWLTTPGIRTLLDVSSGVFKASDRHNLEQLIEKRERDPLVLYSYGQLLRHYGEYDQAMTAFSKAESLLGKQPWTVAERGLIYFALGNSKAADRLFKEAEKLGLATPEFYFDYSKIKFELLDTAAARQLYARARKLNSTVVDQLQSRDDALGKNSAMAVAEIRPPFKMIINSALLPIQNSKKHYDQRAATIMPGTNSKAIVVIGLLLWGLFFLVGKRREKKIKFHTVYSNYSLSRPLVWFIGILPGGVWALAGKPMAAFAVVTATTLALMPLLGWPFEVQSFFELLPGLTGLYVSFLAGLIVVSYYLGYLSWEEA